MTHDGDHAVSDGLDHGRKLEFGGAGGFLQAAQAIGASALTAGQSLAGVHPGPEPAHPIPIWIGANKPRAMALTGRIGNGWVSPLMVYKPPAEANRAIDRAAIEAGRDPRDVRRIYNIQGSFTRQPTQAFDTDGDITGPPEQWTDVLTHFARDLGFDTFILAGDNDERPLTTFIADVAPAVCQQVAEARALSPRDVRTEQRKLP